MTHAATPATTPTAPDGGTDPRFPIGRWTPETGLAPERRRQMIDEIRRAPADLRAAVAGLTPAQLDTPYRPGGWTVRQVAHHVPDSHMNALVRFKLSLTEDRPTIKPYDEAEWAKLADVREVPVETSLALLDAVHARWDAILRSITDEQWTARGYIHPEMQRFLPLEEVLSLYAWHGKHHVAHVTSLRRREGW